MLLRVLPVVLIPVVLAACGGWEGPPPPLDAAAFEEAESRLEVMIDRGRAGGTGPRRPSSKSLGSSIG